MRIDLAALAVARCSLPPALAGICADEQATGIVTGAIDGFIRPGLCQPSTQAARRSSKPMQALCATRRRSRRSRRRGNRFGETVDAWSRDRDHPLRPGDRGQPARAHAVLAGPQGHRPEAGAGGARGEGRDARPTPAAWPARASPCRGSARWNSCCSAPAPKRWPARTSAYRCAYGAAIAGNLDSHRRRARRRPGPTPDGFAAHWANPGADNPLYRDGTEAVTELIGRLRHRPRTGPRRAARRLPRRDARRRQAESRRCSGAPARRSTRSPANFAGMKALFEASRLGEARARATTRWIGKSALFEFGNAASAAAAAIGPVAEVLADPARRDKLDYLGLVTSSLSDTVRHQPVAANSA